jgi:type IV pilus assembly protein PilC
MADFRFQGVVPSGKMIQGTISAGTPAEARKKIHELSKGRSFRLSKLEKRTTFIYKAQKGEKVTEGEQKAYSKAEVENALTSMGYKVVYVRKRIGLSMGKPPVGDLITFVRLSADLLREKLPFNEVLNLLSNDIENKTLKATLKDINSELRK